VPQSRGPGPFGLRGSLPPLAAGIRSSCFGRVYAMDRRVCQTRSLTIYRQKGEEYLPLLKAPPKQPKSATIQVRVEENVRLKLDKYAEFIDSSPSYVVTEALKLLFKKDEEFKSWLGQHTNDHNQQQNGGESIKDTAKHA